jgi:hypothetical protein
MQEKRESNHLTWEGIFLVFFVSCITSAVQLQCEQNNLSFWEGFNLSLVSHLKIKQIIEWRKGIIILTAVIPYIELSRSSHLSHFSRVDYGRSFL